MDFAANVEKNSGEISSMQQVKHKIPLLFQEIIDHQNSSVLSDAVVQLQDFVEWKKKKQLLMRSAERFIQKQRSQE